MDLSEKRIIIIGGSSGIGLAIARAAALEGATILIAGRSQERLQSALQSIQGRAEGIYLDVSSEESVQTFFSNIGSFDHLATPGSSVHPGGCLHLETAKARESFDSKFWGQYFAAKYGAPQIRPGGSIVLFSGVLGHRPLPETATIAAVNGAIEAFGRALALEIAPIRVNTICAGYVDTPLFAKLTEKEREALFDQLSKELLVKRIGLPEEIAETALYLMSNNYTTGSTIFVDGGFMLR
ncbi:MAG TPA: SDR family oxidoreductase [Rhabdochlamydiaceae bacterium]|nr:SDR family oxidoreductase [Rhabdochlamydiaceae bacterium]